MYRALKLESNPVCGARAELYFENGGNIEIISYGIGKGWVVSGCMWSKRKYLQTDPELSQIIAEGIAQIVLGNQ